MSQATLTINSRNYGAWSLRGWLLCKFAGLDFTVEVVDSHDPDARAELLLLSPSFLVPRLRHDDLVVWDTLAIGEYLHEYLRRLPPPRRRRRGRGAGRSRARSTRASPTCARRLPMNIKARPPGLSRLGRRPGRHRPHREPSGTTAWPPRGGPSSSARSRTVADAMYAAGVHPVPDLRRQDGAVATDYVETILAMPEMVEWMEAARLEPDDVEELEMEF